MAGIHKGREAAADRHRQGQFKFVLVDFGGGVGASYDVLEPGPRATQGCARAHHNPAFSKRTTWWQHSFAYAFGDRQALDVAAAGVLR